MISLQGLVTGAGFLFQRITDRRRARGLFPGLVPGVTATALLIAVGCTSAGGPRKQVLNAPDIARLAPYSSAIRTGDLIFFSGLIGNRAGALVEGGVQAETRQALENLSAVMAVAGVAKENVVKCTVFLVDIADYSAMNEVYGAFFQPNPPARSAVAVAALPAGAHVEIECIAAAR